jgi:hypothetical protein
MDSICAVYAGVLEKVKKRNLQIQNRVVQKPTGFLNKSNIPISLSPVEYTALF